MAKGYWVAHVTVSDPDNYPKYIAANAAAGVMGIMMTSSIIGRVGVGKVADAIGGVRALLLFSAIQTVFVFWLSQMHTLLGFFAMSMLFGIGYGGIIPAYAIILRERMPIHRVGGSVGLVFFFANAGMGIGGYMGGALFDWSGTYTLALCRRRPGGLGQSGHHWSAPDLPQQPAHHAAPRRCPGLSPACLQRAPAGPVWRPLRRRATIYANNRCIIMRRA